METPIPFEQEFPQAAAALQWAYATKKNNFFGVNWLHFFSNGTHNNLPYGRYKK